jgi:SAM-dependent methyltransferase
MEDWKQIYKNEGVVQAKPSKQVIELVPIFKQEGIEKILDLGCGTGRHVRYLALQGFRVFGVDYSIEAIEKAKSLTNGIQNIELAQSPMSSIPYNDSFFDAIVCSQVIQHGLKDERDRAFNEIRRTLKSNGLLFLRTTSRNHKVYGRGEQIEPHTFVNIPELPDGKTPHHYFSEEELRSYLAEFDILSLKHHSFPPEPNSFWKYGLEEWALLGKKR